MDINYYEEEIIDYSGEQMGFVKNPNYIPGCNRTYLLQRLNSPRGNSVFAFGGFCLRGGFNESAWKLVHQICSFDYMGAAEFEFGAVPEAFQKMAENSTDLEAYLLPVSAEAALPRYGRVVEYLRDIDYKAKKAVLAEHPVEASVYVLAPKAIRPHVEQSIRKIADGSLRLKERSDIDSSLFECPNWQEGTGSSLSETIGWLELDNGFAFFTCEEMWRHFCQLFNVEIPSNAIEGLITPDFSAVDAALRAAT